MDVTEPGASDGALSACAGEWVVDCGGWILTVIVDHPRAGQWRLQIENLEIIHLLGIVKLPPAHAQNHAIGEAVCDSESRHDLFEIEVVERTAVARIGNQLGYAHSINGARIALCERNGADAAFAVPVMRV